MNSILQSKDLRDDCSILSLYECLAISQDEIKLGKVTDGDEVFDELIRTIDDYEL